MVDAIRDATVADLPRIVEIYNQSIPGRMATADLSPVTVESRLGWFHDHTPDCRPLWVLEQDQHAIAWISLQSFYGRPAYQATAEVSVYVDQDYQRQGLGSQLLQQMIATCPRLGITTLLSFVFDHNTYSLKMCERLGFQRWGLLPDIAELDGIKRGLVILGCKIP
jgi:L-amino acid N-acyltransferase YncA